MLSRKIIEILIIIIIIIAYFYRAASTLHKGSQRFNLNIPKRKDVFLNYFSKLLYCPIVAVFKVKYSTSLLLL